jgi:nitrite reductase (NADH) small subunit
MAEEIFVARSGEIEEGGRRLIQHGETTVGVFRSKGRYYAYRNRCVHQGGPVCQGVILGKVEVDLDEDRAVVRERFSEDEIHVVCPWHGFEYDLHTGECATDRSLRLTRYPVVEREGGVYVHV